MEAVERSLKSEPAGQQETVWGLANGLTQAGQALAPDGRYAVEVLAGRLIEHGPPRVSARSAEDAPAMAEEHEGKELGNGDRPSRPVLGRA